MIKKWQKVRADREFTLSDLRRIGGNTTFMDWIGYCIIRHAYFDIFDDVDMDLEASGNMQVYQYDTQFALQFYNNRDIQLKDDAVSE